ncbi:MAG TPA: MFS transporter [Ktedonobacteraceae bacterium]|nr:MFS transporter [Ktedonobacteraceae bacterium]
MHSDKESDLQETDGSVDKTEGQSKKLPFLIRRNFALQWSGQTISVFGSHITGMGLELTANLTLRANASQMGLLAALGSAPVLLVGLFAGVWVDRVRRRPVMIASDLARALLLVTVPVAAVLGLLHIEQLYVVTVLVGMLTVFYQVANQSFLPTLVRREEIVEANGKLSASSSLAEIGGPTLGGVLVQMLTAPFAILFDVASFLVSALCTSLIRVREPAPVPQAEGESAWKEMREGLRLLSGNSLLRAVTVSSAIRNFSGSAFAALYGLYVIRVLDVTPALFGVLVTAGGAGALLGAFATGRIVRHFGTGRVLIGAMLLAAVLSLLTPLATGPDIIVYAMLFTGQLIGDFGLAIYLINEVSLLQVLVPDQSLGKASASMRFLIEGMIPIGAILAGMLGTIWGMRLTLLAGCMGFCLSALWLVFSPLRTWHEGEAN